MILIFIFVLIYIWTFFLRTGGIPTQIRLSIYKIYYNKCTLVLLRYTRMAGFGRREIEYMQALCIYKIYIEYYSVDLSYPDIGYPGTHNTQKGKSVAN